MLQNQEKPFGHIYERKRKDGSILAYRAVYLAPHSSKRVTKDCPTHEQAVSWLQQEQLLVQADQAGISTWTHPRVREGLAHNPRFHDWAKPYYETHLRQDAYGNLLAPATLRVKDLAFARLDKHFGNVRLQDITPRMVQAMVHQWNGEPTPIRTMYILLHALLRDAANPPDGSAPLIEHNPCTMKAPAKLKRVHATAPVSDTEIAAIIHAMPEYTAISIHLALAFGLRIAEICALQVGDFNFQQKTLTIRHSVRRGQGDTGPMQVAATKTATSIATMPVPDALIDIIQRHIIQFSDTNPTSMVVHPQYSHVMNPGVLRRHFDKAKRQAGRPDITFHTLRATAISEIVHQGGEPKEVQAFGRHADVQVSLEHYQRARGETKQRELANRAYRHLIGSARTLEDVEQEITDGEKQLRNLTERLRRLYHVRDAMRESEALHEYNAPLILQE